MIAVVAEKAPIKARGAQFGGPKSATSNAEWRFFSHNPKGWSHFFAQLRCQSLM